MVFDLIKRCFLFTDRGKLSRIETRVSGCSNIDSGSYLCTLLCYLQLMTSRYCGR